MLNHLQFHIHSQKFYRYRQHFWRTPNRNGLKICCQFIFDSVKPFHIASEDNDPVLRDDIHSIIYLNQELLGNISKHFHLIYFWFIDFGLLPYLFTAMNNRMCNHACVFFNRSVSPSLCGWLWCSFCSQI